MLPLMTFLSIFSLLFSGCAIIKRPNSDICAVNAGAGHRLCYNLREDYNNDGNRKPNAKPKFKPAATVIDLDRNICTDPDGFAEIVRYIEELREALDDKP